MENWKNEYFKQGAKFFYIAKIWLWVLTVPLFILLISLVVYIGALVGSILKS